VGIINKHLRLTRNVVHLVFLALFIFLFLKTQYTGEDILRYPVNLFLRLDPFLALTSFIASREIIDAFLISFYIVLLTLLFGRVWCGWICPMGTLIDILHNIFFKKAKRIVDSEKFRNVKYYILFFLVLTSVFSLSLSGYLDPISILTRTFTLSIYPAINAMFEQSLIAGYTSDIGFISSVSDSAYVLMKEYFLAFKQPVYYLNFFTFFVFFLIIFLERYEKRFWCKNLCPSGALLALISPFALIKRKPIMQCADCETGCNENCKLALFSGEKEKDYLKKECIYCFDCIEKCPNTRVEYYFGIEKRKKVGPDLTKRGLIGSLSAGVVAYPLLRINPLSEEIRIPARLIRPPGALNEKDLTARCLRCGECMRVCIQNAIQPSFFEAGAEGLWTPKMDMRLGYCEYDCTLCGQTCPSQAIKELSLEEKHKDVIGKAVIDKNRCIPYAKGIDCIVCEEHCPTLPKKAILFKKETVIGEDGVERVIKKPYVDEELCIGCGICEHKCPLEKQGGILIYNQKKVIKEGFFVSTPGY
jgi:polyferredoxin